MSTVKPRIVINRRDFITLAALSVCAGCMRHDDTPRAPINLGQLNAIPIGMSIRKLDRIALIRDVRGLSCISLICTHQHCIVTPQAQGFVCPCHGSTFDTRGVPESGPATTQLNWHSLSIDSEQNIILDINQSVDADWRLTIPTDSATLTPSNEAV